MFLTSRVHLANLGMSIFNMIDRESQAMAAALFVKAASDLLVRLFLAMLVAWERARSQGALACRSGGDGDPHPPRSAGKKETQHSVGTFAGGESRDHGGHGTRQSNPGIVAAHREACDRVQSRRDAGHRPPIDGLDGPTLLLDLQQISRASRRKDTRRGVPNQQLQRRDCMFRACRVGAGPRDQMGTQQV